MYILGVKIDNLSLDEALEKIEGFLGGGNQHYIVLPYADFLVRAQKDGEFRKILNEADLSLSDGAGPVLASRIIGQEALRGRMTGIDLIWAIFDKLGAHYSVFLYGAKEGVAREAAEKIKVKYPASNIVGTLNGYGDFSLPSRTSFGISELNKNEMLKQVQHDKKEKQEDWLNDEAIFKINASGAEILLVALGMPKQEKWIYNNLKKLPAVKLAIGVGGAFDFISGRIRRAPKFVQKVGMEWLWRLFSRPSQWRKTWRSVIIFSWLVLKEIFKK